MKILQLFVFVLFTLISCQSVDRSKIDNSDHISVPIYKVTNKDLISVLDSFILNEKKYDYYDSTVVLYANTMNNDGTILQFSSGGKGVSSPVINRNYADATLAVFYHNKNMFVLYGRSIVSSKLMTKTNAMYSIATRRTDDETQAFEDDSYFPTIWVGKFDGVKFRITVKSNMKGDK